MKKILVFSVLALFLVVGNSYALTLDLTGWTDITTFDNMPKTGGWDGSSDPRVIGATDPDPRFPVGTQIREDTETESGTVESQAWDLEGIFLKGNSMAIVGGYNFEYVFGYAYNSTPGDIFFSIDAFENPATISPTYPDSTTGDRRGYEYVFNFNIDRNSPYSLDANTYTYDVYDLTPTIDPITGEEISNVITINANDPVGTPIGGSSPWIYGSGGDLLSAGNSTAYYDAVTGDSFGGIGRYALVVDLSDLGFDPIGAGEDPYTLWAKFTMQCGNDNIVAYTSYSGGSVPEPSAMFLMGVGFFGLAVVARKKMFK